MQALDKTALTLTLIGGINWGLVGFFKFDLVAWLFGGQDSPLARIVFALVGVCAVWCISILFKKIQPSDSYAQT